MGLLGDYLPNLLPDDPDKNAAARQGLLAFGAALANSRGGLLSGATNGLLAGSGAYQGALQQQQKDQMEAAQLKLLQNKDARDQRLNTFIADTFGSTAPSISGAGGPAAAPPSSKVNGPQQGTGVSTAYNGTPYTADEAAEAGRASTRAGMTGYEPDKLNQVMALARQGIGVDQAAQSVFSGAPAQAQPFNMPRSDPQTPWSAQSITSLPRLDATAGQGSPPPTPVPPGHTGKNQPIQPRNNSFPLSLNQVAALKAFGGPDMMDAYKFSQEGVQRQQGSTYLMPDGTSRSYAKLDNGQVQGDDGMVSNAPGYLDSFSATERARADASEGAKADYDVLDPTKFIGADGRPIASTRGAYIKSIGELPKQGSPSRVAGTQAPTPIPPGRAGTQFPVVTPQEQRTRDVDRLSILQDELRQTSNPADVAALQREIASTTRNIGGGAGGGRGAPVLQSPAEARTQMGEVDTNIKVGQDLNSNWIKEVHNPVQADGKAARVTLAQIQTLQNVNFKTGWGAEAKAAGANILATLGVKDAAQYAGNAQKFQQIAMERNLTMLQAQSGPQTEGDSQRAQQTFVRLQNTPAANQYIADLTAANARIALQKADYYNRALPLAKQRGDMTEIDRRWNKIAPSLWSDPALAKYQGKK